MELILYLLILIPFLFGVPVLVLTLRDKYFRARGMRQDEINRKSVIWMISPVMIVFSIIFIVGGFLSALQRLQTESFVFGFLIGSVYGVIFLYTMVFKNKRSLQRLKKDWKNRTYWAGLGVLTVSLFGSSIIFPFFDLYPSFAFILIGFSGIVALFAILTHFFLAVFRRTVLLQ